MRRKALWTVVTAGALFAASSTAIGGQGYSRGPTQGEGLIRFVQPNGVTPRTPDGKPDLSGMYTNGNHMFNWGVSFVVQKSEYKGPRCQDCGGEAAQAVMDRSMINKPLYKPEYWQTVQDLDFSLVNEDPQFRCEPQGLPRIGIPIKVVQTPKEVIFWQHSYPIGYRTRSIPVDGRTHKPEDRDALTSDGIPVGRWEGDVLVIDSVGFDDKTWMGWPGYIHSNQMTVRERVWRNGDLLYWQATVTDPVMLQEPWVMDTQVRRINPDPADFVLEEALPCEGQDEDVLLKIAPRYRG